VANLSFSNPSLIMAFFLRLAPFSIKVVQAFSYLFNIARVKAVFPYLSSKSISAPFLNKYFIDKEAFLIAA
jgi:hypothetical protein